MKVKTNVSLIIPTLNNVNGLKFILNYFKDKDFKVIVVDNCPTEEKKKVIVDLDSRLRGNDTGPVVYLPQEKNLGFAGGVNKGVEDVETKWMLILNDDIEFKVKSEKLRVKNYNLKLKIEKEETIQRLISFAGENNLDAVSPVLKNPDGKVENYGYKVLPIGRVELIKEMDSRLRGNDNNIDGITAACLLVKTKVFKKLGGFNESFFAYLEDVDFFLRLKKLKDDSGQARMTFGLAYDVEVLHNHMVTSKTMGNFKARQDMINWWRLYFKHPNKFKVNLAFIMERLRNVSGYLKATFK
jgi:GT2 family glycosyltransferase